MAHRRLTQLAIIALLMTVGLGTANAAWWEPATKWAAIEAAPLLSKLVVEAGLSVGIEETVRMWLEWHRGPTDAKAQYELGLAFAKGDGVERDEAQAETWYTKSANQGFAQAQLALAQLYYARGEHQRSVPWVRKAAAQGLARAEAALGYDYLYGDGVAKDVDESERWLLPAAQQQDWYGAYHLVVLYNDQKDFKRRNHWLRVLAETGEHQAENNLGAAYANGEGFAQPDPASAVYWFQRAAAGRNTDGAFNLGRAYQEGFGGLPRNLSRAAELYAAAETQGDSEARTVMTELCKLPEAHDTPPCMSHRQGR